MFFGHFVENALPRKEFSIKHPYSCSQRETESPRRTEKKLRDDPSRCLVEKMCNIVQGQQRLQGQWSNLENEQKAIPAELGAATPDADLVASLRYRNPFVSSVGSTEIKKQEGEEMNSANSKCKIAKLSNLTKGNACSWCNEQRLPTMGQFWGFQLFIFPLHISQE